MDTKTITVRLTQQAGYAFLVDFGENLPELLTDEPAPLGEGRGPNPSRLLLAAIANCLAASLTFALKKYGNAPGPIEATISGELQRNSEGRWRIPQVVAELKLAEHPGMHKHLDRVLAQFEAFCIVTQSVRDGIDVQLRVRDRDGHVLVGDRSFEAGA